jgi:hypothetical protein
MLTPLSNWAFCFWQLGLKPHEAKALFALFCKLYKMLAPATNFQTLFKNFVADPAGTWVQHIPWLNGHRLPPAHALLGTWLVLTFR